MKKFLIIITLFLSVFFMSGCLKQDTYDDINAIATAYPIEYIMTRLYGKHAGITSIYPDGINISEYELTEEQISEYSNNSLYVFNGLSAEKEYVIPMIKNNSNLKIIDASMNMTYNYDIAELWLNPSNFLMLSQNIKTGLNEYISNQYLKEEINENYKQLKVEISTLDASIKLMADNADKKTIIVDNDAFKFLEKYGITVISIEENDNLTEKTIADAKALIKNGTCKAIFTYQYGEESNTLKQIVEETGVKKVTLETLGTISADERSAKADYITIMNENIDAIKDVLYE